MFVFFCYYVDVEKLRNICLRCMYLEFDEGVSLSFRRGLIF